MRRLPNAIAATTAAIALSWTLGPLEPAQALVCQVPDLPPKDLSKLPEIECR